MKNSMKELHVDKAETDLISSALEDLVDKAKDEQIFDGKFHTPGTACAKLWRPLLSR